MKIQKINSIPNNIKFVNFTKPIQKAVKKAVVPTADAAALSGLYLTLKAVQEKKEHEQILKNIGFSNEFSVEILKNPVFDKKGLQILSEVEKLEDKTFYTQIIKNIENIDSLKKDDNKTFVTYKMTAKTPDEKITVNYSPSIGLTNISSVKENLKTEISHFNTSNEIKDNTVQYVDNKIVSNSSVIFNKKTNVITRKINNKVVNETAFYPNGVINDITKINNNYSVTRDFKNNQTIKTNNNKEYTQINSLVKTYINPLTGKTETLNMEMSDIAGVYNSTITDINGNKKTESLGRINSDGSIYVEKNFESLDGTKTKYRYNSTENKQHIKMFYQITDKNGKNLSTIERTFDRISPELANSSINGHKYGMKRTKETIEVTDYLTGEKTNINIKDLALSKDMNLEIFDNMSADMLLDFYKNGFKYQYESDILNNNEDSKIKVICSNDNIFNFEHEHGHAKDIKFYDNKEYLTIADNPLFKKVYEEERFAFINNCPQIEKDYIDYFINKTSHYAGEKGGLRETVAEINALLSTDAAGADPILSTRGYYLQKYFPKTIALAAKLLNPNSNLYVKS